MRCRGEKRVIKRNLSVLSSVGSSPLSSPKARKIKMSSSNERWKCGAYNEIFLSLLYDAKRGRAGVQGKPYTKQFWRFFTDKLNLLIKGSLPPAEAKNFGNFTGAEVIEYGEVLKQTYINIKHRPNPEEAILHFNLFNKVFRDSKHKAITFPRPKTMLGIQRPRGCAGAGTGTGTGTGTSASVFWPDIADSVTTELSSLVNRGSIKVNKSVLALKAFQENPSLAVLWLKMNDVRKAQYVRRLH